MGAEGRQTTAAPEGVEPMEDVEEEKVLPPDQPPNTGHGENDGSGSKNHISSQSKKRVHFGDEGKGINDSNTSQRKYTDSRSKSGNPSRGKKEMVYAVKKPKAEEVKGQPKTLVAKEVIKAAEQQRKQRDGGENKKKNAEATGRKENTKGSNTEALGDKDKERRRDRSSEGKERRRDSTRGPKK
jgi:hypothetical protein